MRILPLYTLSGAGRRKRRINDAGVYFLGVQVDQFQLHPVAAQWLRRSASLNVEASNAAIVFLLVGRRAYLMQRPLFDHIVAAVEVGDDVDVMIQLMHVTLPSAVVAFNHRHDPLVLDDALGHWTASA